MALKHVLDLFDPANPARMAPGHRPRAKVAIAYAYRHLLKARDQQIYTPATVRDVAEAAKAAGAKHPNRILSNAWFEGLDELVFVHNAGDDGNEIVRVPLRQRSAGLQDEFAYAVHGAADALARAFLRFAREMPQDAVKIGRHLFAEEERGYRDLLRLATATADPQDPGKRAISDIRRATTRARHRVDVQQEAA